MSRDCLPTRPRSVRVTIVPHLYQERRNGLPVQHERRLVADTEHRGRVIQPDSIVWRRGGDPRLLLVSGYALILQVAHPTVASAVRDHSTFEQSPWRRLVRTLDWVNLIIYGGEDAIAAGKRLRRYHRSIKGTDPDGTHYDALDPEAYAWVHATLVDAMVLGHARFGRPLRPDQVERFYHDWRRLGRLLGLRAGQLPPDWGAFRRYFDEMVDTRLQANPTVDRVLHSLRQPLPAVGALPEPVWTAALAPVTHVMLLVTAGLLPPVLRERFGMTWGWSQDCELAALGAACRSFTPLMPPLVRVIGFDYLRMRRRQLAQPAPLRAGQSQA
jgi:uncharacterized protein (DUF2236 family)